MNVKGYNRSNAVLYAMEWAFSRNPQYYNFDPVGGDCTSFVSQCIYAGSNVMNYDKINGWYYINGYEKSPSWSGVEFLYNFLVKNIRIGPRGKDVVQNRIEIGDLVQLSFSGIKFEHSLIITRIDDVNDLNKIFTSSHTFDSLNKKISEYSFSKIRFVHINDIGIN